MNLYQKINRQYEEQRRKNRELEEARRREIYRKIPDIEQIDTLIRSLGFQGAMEQVKNPDQEAAISVSEEIHQLRKEKINLLTIHNYPANYLDPQYYCIDCQDKGILDDGDRCHCFKQKLSEELYEMSNISHVLEQENFDTFNLNLFSDLKDPQEKISPKDNMRMILQSVRSYIDSFYEPNDFNFIFYGPTGQGKTFMLNCIAKELMDLNVNVIYQTAFEIIEILENKKFGRDPVAKEQYQLLFDADLLIVDDLGIEFVNSFTNSEIFNIINTRLLRGKKTLISTNLSPKELSETYTDRVFSRVFQKFVPIKFFGEDLRWQK